MTKEERKQMHMVAAMLAMQGYIAQGMRSELIADAAYLAADDLISKYDEEQGIVAALKTKGRK